MNKGQISTPQKPFEEQTEIPWFWYNKEPNQNNLLDQ